MAWLTPVLWPFLRVLAMFSVAPMFSMRAIPMRAKVGLAFVVAVCAQAALPAHPVISLNSPQAVGVLVQQIGVGLAVGFAVRLVFAAVELAGQFVGLHMGLGFASFFDPVSGSQANTVARFLGQMTTLLFIVLNGHLLVLMAVIHSFERFPVDGYFLESVAQMRLHELGAGIFSSALWIALPITILLLFINFTMGIISRVAPQMNIFAVGFPVTITVGLLGVAFILPMLDRPMLALLERSLDVFGAH